MSDYVSRAAAELEEAKLQQKITDSLIEALGWLETKELRQIQLRSDVWGALDKPIQAIIDQSGGREPVARMLLVSALWRIMNLLTSDEPLPVGLTIAQEEREVQRRLAAEAAAKPLADSPEPQSEPVKAEPEPQHQSTCTKLPDGRIQVAFVRPNGQVRNFIADRKRSRPRTYQQIMARKTPEQQAEFRRKRRDIQRIYRATRKLALVPNS
jgi:hypothetical protein